MSSRFFKKKVSLTTTENLTSIPNLPQLILSNVGNEDIVYDFDGNLDGDSPVLVVGSSIQLNGLGANTVHAKALANTSKLQIIGVRTIKQ